MRTTGTILLAGAAAVLVVGCDSSTASTSSSASAAAAQLSISSAPTAAPTTAEASTAPVAAVGDLSGTWSGQYSGSYQGTFTLTWTQSGSTLSGKIALSSPHQTLNINGTLQGTTISFGTLGSVAITYSGSVSGSSMSGNYLVAGTQNGSWSAAKTS